MYNTDILSVKQTLLSQTRQSCDLKKEPLNFNNYLKNALDTFVAMYNPTDS